ncbi:hypothetical protein Bca4012_082434 [Brassica carinata]
MKGYYDGPYPNWSSTPEHVKTTWFKQFMQKWNWSVGITERVKREFIAKAKPRLCNTVSDWKDKWEIYGNEGKRTGHKGSMGWSHCLWQLPSSIRKANSCSASRRTKDKDGNLPMVHRTGQKPHAGIRLEVVRRRQSSPSLSDLFKMTHASREGFVDPASEKLFNAVATRIVERETQLTQQSADGLPVKLSTEEIDRIFEEVAPRMKGRTVGIGSVNEVARATLSYHSRRDQDNERMQARLDTQQERLDSLESLLDIMAVGNPTMQALWRTGEQLRGCNTGSRRGTSWTDASANYFDDVGL